MLDFVYLCERLQVVLFAPDKSEEFELGEPKILALDPQGWAVSPKNNAHFAHRDAGNTFLEVEIAASKAQVKFKEMSFWFGPSLKFSIWSTQLVKL